MKGSLYLPSWSLELLYRTTIDPDNNLMRHDF